MDKKNLLQIIGGAAVLGVIAGIVVWIMQRND